MQSFADTPLQRKTILPRPQARMEVSIPVTSGLNRKFNYYRAHAIEEHLAQDHVILR